MAEKTLEERLSELYEKIDHRDQFFDKDLKTLIDGIRDAREHGGTASVDVTPIVGGYKIVITDSEGVEHVATVKDGADGQDGAPGAPGHNPNLGTYLDTDIKPTMGQAGDYIYVVDTSVTPRTANVWAWNGTAFADTGKSVEDFGLQFASGQAVNDVKIKDENGEEVQGNADVLSAEAGKELNEQLNGKEANYEDGKKIRWTGSSSEVVESDSTFILSEYVQIPNGATTLVYTYANSSISPTGMSWYDESKIWLSSSGANADNGERVLSIVSNAKYVRASFLKSTMGTRASLAFKDANNVVLKTWVPMEAQLGNIESLQSNQTQLGRRLTDIEESVEEVTGTEQNYIPHKRVDALGAIVDRNTTGLSVLIPIESAVGTSVRFNVGTSNLTDSGLAFYSSDGTSFLGWWAGNAHPRTIQLDDYPSGAYLRMTFWLEEASSAYIEIKYAGDSDYARVWEPSEGTPSKYVQAKPQTFTEEEQNQIKRNLGIDKSGENVEFQMRNGSQGNPGNAYVITIYGKDTLAIPVEEGKKYKVVLNKQPENGYEWFYSLFTYNTTSPSTLNANSIRNEGNSPSAHSLDELISINTGEYGLSIQLSQATHKGATPQSEYNHAIRVSDFMDSDILVLDVTDSAKEHIEEIETRVSSLEHKDVVARNEDKLPMLINSCRLYGSSDTSKNFQVAICTDMHGARLANQNVIKAVNDFIIDENVPLIDAYVNCGDIMSSFYVQSDVDNFQSDFKKLTRPGFVVCGNHDVGNAYYVGYCCNHLQAYNAFIKPMVDKGFLVSGEYEAGKPYWYHDINNTTREFKVRIIGLYEYDDALAFNETYWKAIPYDSNLSAIQLDTSYSVGNKVNATNNYTEYSFECVQAVTTPSSFYPKYNDLGKIPSYIVHRGQRVIRQDQAQWFLNTLASTPANSGIVVVMHNPFGLNAVSIDAKFSYPSGVVGSSMSQNLMTTDFIRDAIVAYINGTNYSENVVMNGSASYLNDPETGYAYHVEKDFSTYKNDNVVFWGFLGGHTHKDLIWKDNVEDVYQISPTCSIPTGPNAYRFSDIRRSKNDGLAYDSITVVSFADGRIGLVKIGANVTDRGTKRDYMVLDTNN